MPHPKSIFGLLALVTLLLPMRADAYPNLCSSAPSVCDYTGPDAPVLRCDVCLSSTGSITIKSGSCPSGSSAYYLDYGEVNPANGQVSAYIPLADACDTPGLCVEYEPHSGGWESVICCLSEDECYPGALCGGVLKWCEDGVSNLDGTVTCFLAEEL